MNGLFVKDFAGNIFDRGACHDRMAKRLQCRRVAAIDIYMLCPRHDFLFQGSDVVRFTDWVSALQADTQRARRIGHQHCPDNVRMGLPYRFSEMRQ